ncbi:MAG: hypothetical protein IPH57_05525 [Saprospiraceae bacterium]|nr:hypothetical protein [Saprospiraceae bacterium]
MPKIVFKYFIFAILNYYTFYKSFGQIDSLKLSVLINEANYHFLDQYVGNRPYLTPFEWFDQNRTQIVKNIVMVDSVIIYRVIVNKADTTQIIIKDNKTIIQNIGYLNISKTSIYLEDGRISKILDGKDLDNLYLYDENDYLIQQGTYGELKKAKRNGKIFEWYRVKDNQLIYVTEFAENNKIKYFKVMRQPESSLTIKFYVDHYTWNGDRLETKNRVNYYDSGDTDSTFLKLEYDRIGSLKKILSWKKKESNRPYWDSPDFITKIDTIDSGKTKISLFYQERIVQEITFDKNGNWIELNNGSHPIRREISYRTKKRR